MKPCTICKKDMEVKKSWQKYCSKKCANKRHIERYWKKRLAAKFEAAIGA